MVAHDIVLYDYWRSSSSFRVRIALNMLGLPYATVPINLLNGEQRGPENLERNPQGLVPTLHFNGSDLTQSLAIIEYLHEITPNSFLLPRDPLERARVKAIAYAIAMEIHPVCNLSVIGHVLSLTNGGEATRSAWMKKFIRDGLVSVEEMLKRGAVDRFCCGVVPTLADICLVPQVYNAGRWEVDITDLRRVSSIAAACNELHAFKAASPRNPAQSH